MNFLKRFILSLFHNSPIGGRGAKRLILSFVLSSPFWGLEGFAQNYPVVVTPFVKTAYSLRWQDYANNDQMLRINLILRDQAKDDIEVYIYFTIKGLGWSISTNPNFVPSQKIKLQRGVPTILRGPDIAEYLAPANVVVEGLPPELVRQGGKLPEGFCSIEVYAHEGFRDRQVSNLGRFDFSIFDLKPPLLFSPADAQTLRAISPPRVLFNWVPQSPILAITGQMPLYRLQVWDASDQAPNATALTNSDKVWTKDVATTSTLMGPDANLTLQEGKRYAWRVTLLQDSQDNSIENQGQSEVWSFLWGGACLPPDPIVLQDWGGGVYRAAWEAISGVDGYLVRFREAGSNAPWQERITQSQSWSLSGPRPFEVQVASVCGTTTSPPSPTVKPTKPTNPSNAPAPNNAPAANNATNPNTIVRIDQNGNPVTTPTPAMEEMVTELQKIPPPKCAQLISTQADCKDQTTPITYTGEPQNALQVGHVLAMHNYKIIVTAISSATANTYSGEGLAAWPFLGQSALVAVKLNNITVVKDKEDTKGGCITKGEAVAGTKGILDADIKARTQTLYDFLKNPTYFTADLERAAEALANKARELKGKTTTPTADDLKYYKQYATATKEALQAWIKDIEAATPNPKPEVVTQILTAIQAQISQLTTAISAPPSGAEGPLPAQIAAWKTQLAQYLTPNRSQLSQVDFSLGRVSFAKTTAHPYGFDAFEPARGSLQADYPNLGSGYIVPFLSLKAGQASSVTANFEPKSPNDPTFTPDNIRFVDSQGQTLKAAYNPNTKSWTIDLPAAPAGQSEVFAYFQAPGKEAKSVGKMLVKRWEMKTKKVQIVRLGNAAPAVDDKAITAALNDIYKPALTQWQVEALNKNINFNYQDGLVDADELASFSNYSPEMKALMQTYFMGNKVDDPNTYYLLVVPGFKPADVKGYMPRGRNVGFVSDVSARNIAHELSHGAFGLRHSFDDQPASQTNLLDYGGGTYLTAAQWDKIQNPGIILNWFDEAEDFMAKTLCAQCICIDGSSLKGKSFIDTENKTIKLRDFEQPYVFKDNKLYAFKSNQQIIVPYQYANKVFAGYGPLDKWQNYPVEQGASPLSVEVATDKAATLLIEKQPISGQIGCLDNSNNDWTPNGDGTFSRTITIEGNVFKWKKEANGDISVQGTWQTFGKCPTCDQVAQKALDDALAKARAKNNGKITEETSIVAATSKTYGTAGSISYSEMKLMDMLKNLSQTYNSLVDKAKVPEEMWQPNKEFFVRDSKALISGTFDGVASEATDKAQLVGLGLKLASDPEGSWNSLVSFKNELDWNKAGGIAKTMAQGIVGYDAAEFDKGGVYANHATGKVAGTVTFNIVTGGLVLGMVNKVPDLLALLGKVIKKLEDANWSKADIDAFTLDFDDAEDILKNFDNGTLDPQAWRLMKDTQTKKLHLPTLSKVTELLKDTDFMAKLQGGEATLTDILKNAANPLDASTASKLVTLTEHLENLRVVVKNHHNVDGFDKILTDLKISTFEKQDGISHSLNHMKDLPAGSVQKVDYLFEAEVTGGLPCTNCRFDVQMVKPTNPPPNWVKYFEYKSYLNAANISLDQFKNYVATVDNLSQLKYVFNAKKLTTAQAKEGMKAFLKKNAKQVFDANPTLFKALNKVDGSGKIQDWEDLLELADSSVANNPIVSFVESL